MSVVLSFAKQAGAVALTVDLWAAPQREFGWGFFKTLLDLTSCYRAPDSSLPPREARLTKTGTQSGIGCHCGVSLHVASMQAMWLFEAKAYVHWRAACKRPAFYVHDFRHRAGIDFY
jgi:hypothetical protein